VNSIIPFVIFIVVVIGLLAFSARARRRQSQVQLERADRIGVGTEVMTTSGLYGTVVARNEDDSVLLAIAPGVEVRWALAALRDLESLPTEYRGQHDDAGAGADTDDAP
jgi:preprotein translocase subunit YajC